jgi:hypothetical protein
VYGRSGCEERVECIVHYAVCYTMCVMQRVLCSVCVMTCCYS